MKKILLATTVLVAGAGIAAAEVTISGSGRFGLQYDDSAAAGSSKTTIDHRLTFNVDASKETDAGVTFGGRIRFRNDEGDLNTVGSQAQLFAEYAGFRLEVGNANGAFDAAGLLWNSEIGLKDSSFGDPRTSFYSFNSKSAPNTTYEGLFASYSVGDFTGRISYIQGNQTLSTLPAGQDDELAISADYASGPFAVSAAIVQNAAGVTDADAFFLGAQYTMNEQATVGLLYIGEADDKGVGVGDRTVTLYGSYAFGATTVKAYVANNNGANVTDTVYGLGADYDLGGATLTGSVQRGYAKETVADLGVKFSF